MNTSLAWLFDETFLLIAYSLSYFCKWCYSSAHFFLEGYLFFFERLWYGWSPPQKEPNLQVIFLKSTQKRRHCREQTKAHQKLKSMVSKCLSLHLRSIVNLSKCESYLDILTCFCAPTWYTVPREWIEVSWGRPPTGPHTETENDRLGGCLIRIGADPPTLGQHHCELPTVLHSKLLEHVVDCEQPVTGVSSKNVVRDSYSGAPLVQPEQLGGLMYEYNVTTLGWCTLMGVFPYPFSFAKIGALCASPTWQHSACSTNIHDQCSFDEETFI